MINPLGGIQPVISGSIKLFGFMNAGLVQIIVEVESFVVLFSQVACQHLVQRINVIPSSHTESSQVLAYQVYQVALSAIPSPVTLILQILRILDNHAVDFLSVFVSQHEIRAHAALGLVVFIPQVQEHLHDAHLLPCLTIIYLHRTLSI